MPYIIFTGLEDYKARGTQASPYYTVTHYTEFAETKDTVLIRGDVVFTSKLTDSEAKTLLETAHSFYLNDVRYRLVERFNKETHDFEFRDVLQVLDMPTMWPSLILNQQQIFVVHIDFVTSNPQFSMGDCFLASAKAA